MAIEVDHKWLLQPLKDGSTENMNVNGSSVSKAYKHAIPASEVWWLYEIRLFLLDPDTMSETNFGSIATLGTGLKIRVKTKEDFIIRNLVCNRDLLFAFSTDVNIGAPSATGFLNEEDYFYGTLRFPEPIKLIGDEGHLIKAVVNDDLTGITSLYAQAMLAEVI